MKYEDFELQVGPRSGAGVLVRVLRSPAGEAEALLAIPEGDFLPSSKRERDVAAVRVPEVLSDTEAGGKLFRAVFRGEIGDLFLQSLSRVNAEGRGLRIRLRINPRDRSLDGLQRLPWELLYRPETEDFLALSSRTPVLRALDVPRSSAPPQVEPPLRILVIPAQHPTHGALDLAGELASLGAVLRSNSSIEVQVLEPVDSGSLRRVLTQKPFHVLHYMGHGTFDPATGEGALLFPGTEVLAEAVTGRHLATKIKDFHSLRLVVLNACRTALAGGEGAASPFAGVATALVLGGVPAVVAMQSPIADQHAVAFSAAFYDRLARGMTLEEAVTEGRQAIHSLKPDGSDWAFPVLFQRNSSGMLPPVLEPAVTPSRGSRRLSLRITAALFSLLLVIALAEFPFSGQGSNSSPISQTKTDPASASAPVERVVRSPRKADRAPVPELPVKKAQERQALPPAKTASGGLRIEVSGQPPDGLSDAVRRAARSLTASGWTLRLEVGKPQISSFDESGSTLVSCSLNATARAEGNGTSSNLGLVRAVGSRFDAGAACDAASEDLAGKATHELQKFLKEESK